jgi:hypothetical protein
MVSLVDIVPQTREVETAHGTIELRGLGLRHIADLFLRFPELRKFFSGNAPEIDPAVLLTEMPDAIGAIIAEAAGQPEAAERIAEAFSPDDAAACLLAVQELTMPAPFFDRLAALLGNSGARGRPNGKAAAMNMPQPPNN